MKCLSSRQARWIQELLKYHFWFDYCQGKDNRAAEVLLQYYQQNAKEEATL